MNKTGKIGTTSLHWIGRGIAGGLILMGAINAVSYFFRSKGIVDIVGHNQRVTEAFGWPFVIWNENAKGIGIVNYESALTNIAVGLAIGGVLGFLALAIRKQLNRQIADFEREQSKSQKDSGSFLQFSMKSLLLITTVTALIIGVLNHWSSVQRQDVESSNIAAVGFSWLTGTLEIEFTDGAVYQYFEFPQSEYEGLMEAESHGRFFHTNIRNKFDFVRAETKRVNGFLLATFLFGPLALVVLAMTPTGISWQSRCVIVAIVCLLLILLAVFGPWRGEMPEDRVMLGIFVFWTPQCAFGALLYGLYWTACSFFKSPKEELPAL